MPRGMARKKEKKKKKKEIPEFFPEINQPRLSISLKVLPSKKLQPKKKLPQLKVRNCFI